MATYRLSMSVAKRSDGRNAVAMAAYRSGQELYSERTGEMLDFTRKGGVLHSELVLPAGAPEWAADRETFWNRSEAADRRGDSVIAREIQLSLPHELPAEQRRALTLEFAGAITARYGIAVDTSLHAPNRHGDERNHHAHLLLCTRPFDLASKTGFGNKLREFDAVAHQRAKTENHVETLRQDWCARLNAALERAGVRSAEGATVQLDHRSYERRGIELEPSVKLGPAASAMERRGEPSDRGDENRAVEARNAERHQLPQEIERLERLRPRLAGKMTAAQVRNQLTPANDDQADYEKPLPWETPDQARAAAEAIERNPSPPDERPKRRDRGFNR